jgi:hypothetical protein
MESWIFLVVGGLGAVGAAMSLGTLAALVRYRSTGELPGGTDDVGGPSADGTQGAGARRSRPPQDPVEVDAAVQRRLLVRIVLGAVVAVACVLSLAEQGLLAGPF